MTAHIALIKGDGIGGDICDATFYLVNLPGDKLARHQYRY